MKAPEIMTTHLRLRMFIPADARPYYQAIHADPEVMRYLPGGLPRPKERSEALIATVINWWSEHRFGLWAVEHLADGRLLGHCGLMMEPGSGAVEVGYAIARPYWGRGLATEGARASLRYGFERIGLDRIIALAVPENVASRRVMEKAGMHFKGISTAYYHGWELALYSLSRQEFAPGSDSTGLIDEKVERKPSATKIQ
jgi:ribosomal-protein-alanine N-acetyltransferase